MHSTAYYYYFFTKKLRQLLWRKELLAIGVAILTLAAVLSTPLPLLPPQVLGVSASMEQTVAPASKNAVPLVINLERRSGQASIVGVDYRAVVLDEYFRRNNSPLYGLGKEFVNACDAYGAPEDCTTIAAIAYVETGLCTYRPSQLQKNCWGFGGAGENRIHFSSYSEAITYVTSKVVKGYGGEYMQNPEWMARTYCGAHCNKWGAGVQQQRNVINNLALELGYKELF